MFGGKESLRVWLQLALVSSVAAAQSVTVVNGAVFPRAVGEIPGAADRAQISIRNRCQQRPEGRASLRQRTPSNNHPGCSKASSLSASLIAAARSPPTRPRPHGSQSPSCLPLTPSSRPFQPQSLSNVSHGQSFGGHRTPWDRMSPKMRW
jgi:hypothetical protein